MSNEEINRNYGLNMVPDSGTGSPTDGQRSPEVMVSFRRLVVHISDTESLLTMIEKKLVPVLRETGPGGSNPEDDIEATGVPLADDLGGLGRRVAGVNRRIHALLTKLEI